MGTPISQIHVQSIQSSLRGDRYILKQSPTVGTSADPIEERSGQISHSVKNWRGKTVQRQGFKAATIWERFADCFRKSVDKKTCKVVFGNKTLIVNKNSYHRFIRALEGVLTPRVARSHVNLNLKRREILGLKIERIDARIQTALRAEAGASEPLSLAQLYSVRERLVSEYEQVPGALTDAGEGRFVNRLYPQVEREGAVVETRPTKGFLRAQLNAIEERLQVARKEVRLEETLGELEALQGQEALRPEEQQRHTELKEQLDLLQRELAGDVESASENELCEAKASLHRQLRLIEQEEASAGRAESHARAGEQSVKDAVELYFDEASEALEHYAPLRPYEGAPLKWQASVAAWNIHLERAELEHQHVELLGQIEANQLGIHALLDAAERDLDAQKRVEELQAELSQLQNKFRELDQMLRETSKELAILKAPEVQAAILPWVQREKEDLGFDIRRDENGSARFQSDGQRARFELLEGFELLPKEAEIREQIKKCELEKDKLMKQIQSSEGKEARLGKVSERAPLRSLRAGAQSSLRDRQRSTEMLQQRRVYLDRELAGLIVQLGKIESLKASPQRVAEFCRVASKEVASVAPLFDREALRGQMKEDLSQARVKYQSHTRTEAARSDSGIPDFDDLTRRFQLIGQIQRVEADLAVAREEGDEALVLSLEQKLAALQAQNRPSEPRPAAARDDDMPDFDELTRRFHALRSEITVGGHP